MNRYDDEVANDLDQVRDLCRRAIKAVTVMELNTQAEERALWAIQRGVFRARKDSVILRQRIARCRGDIVALVGATS